MASKRGTEKVSKIIERSGAPDDASVPDGFVERVLMSLVMDISLLSETVTRVRVQVMAMAKERGIEPPDDL